MAAAATAAAAVIVRTTLFIGRSPLSGETISPLPAPYYAGKRETDWSRPAGRPQAVRYNREVVRSSTEFRRGAREGRGHRAFEAGRGPRSTGARRALRRAQPAPL